MAEFIITVIFMIPIYGLFIWTYFYPEESILFGRRWMYKEEPELSKEVIRYTKFVSIVAMVGLPIVLISIIFDIYLLRFVLVLGFPFIFIFGLFKIFK
ncbi:hypothetical protein [Chengkuizengella sediminis]|uniref:hypothetical protein n=1 Tax=Chengkuizengella sediminis TaxID=1885917 RepID=UPI00196ACD4B|nr:hypothetical protein [Chengkuizengella sediminis]